MNALTPEQRERLRELVAKMTSGPYEATYVDERGAVEDYCQIALNQQRVFCLTAPSKNEGKVAVIAMVLGEEYVDRMNALALAETLNALPALLSPSPSEPSERERPFADRVNAFVREAFTPHGAVCVEERTHRFLEESLELAQATGCTEAEAHQLVEYVFGRPKGEQWQEAGGVMLTLSALCRALGLDHEECGERELERAKGKIDVIRQKHLNKPRRSPLPGQVLEAAATPSEGRDGREEFLKKALDQAIDGDENVRFVIAWEDMDGEQQTAAEGCVNVQFDEIYGAEMKAPELHAYLRERSPADVQAEDVAQKGDR